MTTVQATPKRRRLNHVLAAAAVLMLTAGFANAAEHPNFILIYTDDQGWADLGVFGATDIRTPNLDRLASEGMRFTNFYVASPVCTPSRAALLTGAYPKRVGLGVGVYFPDDQRGLHPEEITIADMLKTLDYSTMLIGKWHLGRPRAVLPTAQGFDHYFGIPYSNDMTADHPLFEMPRLPLMEDERVIENGNEGDKGFDQTDLTVRYTNRAVSFIEDNRDGPFFLYLAYSQPHFPNYASAAWAGSSGRGRYGDAVQEIDWSVGEILATLEETGLDENTVVMFASDNGPWRYILDMAPDAMGTWSETSDGTTGSALPLRGWKNETLEGGPRVPFIVRWPGHVPAGISNDALVTNMDILPTIAALTHIDVSDFPKIDGHSIVGLLTDPDGIGSPTEYFLYYDSSDDDGDGYPDLRAVRDADGWKLQIEDEAGAEVRELYFLPEDISTTNDLSQLHPDKVGELLAAAATIDADVSAGIRPEWTAEAQK
jgi:arylsulfatase A-like enzyme